MSYCRLSHYAHYRTRSVAHVAHLNLIMLQVVTKFCAHFHDVQEGGLTHG